MHRINLDSLQKKQDHTFKRVMAITRQDRVLNHYEYDAFGNTISCEERVANRFRYQGEQYDPVTRQNYLRARYYNPVDSKSGYKDSGVGNGNDPWRSYSSRNGSNILFLPGLGQSSFNVGERIVSKSVFENYIQGKSEFKLGSPGAESFFFNKPGGRSNCGSRSIKNTWRNWRWYNTWYK